VVLQYLLEVKYYFLIWFIAFFYFKWNKNGLGLAYLFMNGWEEQLIAGR